MEASKDYRDNMFGASYVSQFLRKKKRGESKDAANANMSCSHEGCGAMDTQGSQTNRQNTGGAQGLSTKAQYASKIVDKEKEAKKMEKIRQDIKKANPGSKSDRSKF